MTITGKVFLFLTLILAAVFPALVQPVWQTRTTNQKALVVETEKLDGAFEGEKRKPGLNEQVVDAERKRKKLRDQVSLEEQRRTTGEESARRMRLMKETELTLLRDALSDSEIRSSTIKSALAQTDQEVNARDAEIKEMDAEVQQAKAFSVELEKQVADLKAKLESDKTQMQKIMTQLQDRERELAGVMKKQPDVKDDDVASYGR